MKIRIGTRKSKLAMVQTEFVKAAIEKKFPEAEIELVPMSTRGDKILDRSLASFGGKGVFTKELEDALLGGVIDLAVHSAKDMPMEFPKGLSLGAVLERADPRDVLVTVSGTKAKDLMPGSVIGTSSLRRELQIRQMNPQVQIKVLRGNVQTRLAKLKDGQYDAILLAAAGLERLGLVGEPGFCFEYFDPEEFVPAPGQGILAVEIRQGELSGVMEAIHCAEAAKMLAAEREYMTLLNAGCNAPCGAYCRREGAALAMTAMYAEDGCAPACVRETGDDGILLARELAKRVRIKGVSLVGAGPGDEGLLTRKGLACVRNADVIVYDNLIAGSILNEARLDARLIYAGKRANRHHLTQDEINDLLVEQAEQGNYVVRLKGGDPYIFGRGGEEALVLKRHGIPFEIVPGVSSSYSVPAYAGIPVTQRELASSFHIITGHEGEHKEAEVLDYDTLAREEGTLIFLMGLKNLGRIAGSLIAHGKRKDTPAAVIQQGTTARQKKAVATLETIEAEAERQGIETPAITVVGDVVSLEQELDWFLGGALAGKRVLLTGTRYLVEELEEVLKPMGAETVSISLIESIPVVSESVDDVLGRVSSFTWLVFTSVNGVELFFDAMREHQTDHRRLAGVKFAVIGRKTGEALRSFGMIPDFVPEQFSGEDLAREWIPGLTKDDRVLLMRAKEGSPVLTEALDQAGIAFEDIALYETWVDDRRRDELSRVVAESDYVTFASASAVKACAGMLKDLSLLAGKVVSIGPSTTKAARELGIDVRLTAAEYTAEGIAAAILADGKQ